MTDKGLFLWILFDVATGLYQKTMIIKGRYRTF